MEEGFLKMNKLKEKMYKNALIAERLNKISKQERQKIIIELLKNKTERELGLELGLSHSTIHDWKTLRQDNTEPVDHISLGYIYIKLSRITPTSISDWGRLEQIKAVVDKLLRCR